MAFVTLNKMLLDARNGRYAVAAFNVENMEMVKAVIGAAEEAKAPVILQTTPSTVRYGTLHTYLAMVKTEAQRASVPVCLHLDHGDSFELAIQAIFSGYSSVMIDGSQKSFQENVGLTKRVVEVSRICQIPVEAELGKVGGKEDDLENSADENTDPEEAAEFVKQTGVFSLAVAIGTAHGFYKKPPVLNKARISEIRKLVSVPLVLHGSSGLSSDDIRECVERGMCKVNFATELRQAYTDAVRELLAEKPEIYDPKKTGTAGMEAVRALVLERIAVCGCAGKAD